MNKTVLSLLIAGSTIFCVPATAWDVPIIGATVTLVEATLVPDKVMFILNTGNGSCPAGTSLTWNGSPQGFTVSDPKSNVRAVYALLMTAKSTGQKINFYGFNNGCVGQFIHLN